MSRFPLSLIVFLALTGCAGQRLQHVCQPDMQAATLETLYFGSHKPAGGIVNSNDWREFLRLEVTPRFPQGLTWWTAEGQWRDASGGIGKETSFVLQIVHPADDTEAGGKIRELGRRYRELFAQEAVLHVTSPACLGML